MPSEKQTVGSSGLSGVSPESQGVPSRAILALLKAYDGLRYPHAFVFRRHGQVVSEAAWAPHRADAPHQLFSLSKSFTSSAVGIALGEGLIPSLDAPVLSFFPEYDTPAVGPLMRKVTLRHLLTMSCGHTGCPSHQFFWEFGHGCDLVKAFLELEPTYEPGTRFAYNSIGTYMLSAVVRKVAGENVSDYLRPRLFEPLGIATPVFWEKCLHHGTDMGGWGLWLSARDLSAAGQLWLDLGRWQGRQLIPEDYMREATSWQIQNGPATPPDWVQGYGFQFWQCQQRCFRGDGAYGQFVVMDRKRDTVLVLTSAIADLQEPLTLYWDTVLFALRDAPLPEDPDALAELRAFESSRLSPSATVLPDALVDPEGHASLTPSPFSPPSPAPAIPSASFAVDTPNKAELTGLSLAPTTDGATVTLRFVDHTASFAASLRAPVESVTTLLDADHAIPVSADLAWIAPDKLRIVALAPGAVNRFVLDLRLLPDGSAALLFDSGFWFFRETCRRLPIHLIPA